MINTKPNSRLFSLFFVSFVLLLQACNTNESFSFEKQNITNKTHSICEGEACPSVDIHLVNIVNDSPICKNINKEIEKAACAVLNLEENSSSTEIKQAIKRFNRSYQEARQEFPEEIPPYEVSIDSEVSFQCQSMLSILMDSYVFTGGAHGYGAVSFINIDRKTGLPIKNKKLFRDYSAFKDYAERVFRSTYEILQSESINSTGFFFENDAFALPENIGFTDTAVILYYNTYEISSYAEGPIEIKMNKEDVASYFAFDIL